MNVKDVHENLRSAVDIALLLHCSVLASHKYERQLVNGNLLRKTQYYHC